MSKRLTTTVGSVMVCLGLLACGAVLTLPVQAQQAVATAGYPAYTYTHLTSNATTVTEATGAGILHTVCVNTVGSGSNTATFFDSTTSSGVSVGIVNTATLGCQIYDAQFRTGLTSLVTTGTSGDITVTFRPTPTAP